MAGDEPIRARMTHSRQTVELTPTESWRLLGSVSLGRIVFTQHAMPAIRPVNHMLDDGDIVIRGHSGAAIVSEASTAPGVVVAYEADDIDPEHRIGWSVVVTGTAYLVTDPGQVARYQQVLTPWVAREMDQVIRIRPAIITGLRLYVQHADS